MTFIKKQSVTSRIIFKYLLEHRLKIFLALVMMIISAAATGLHAWLVRPALDEVLIKGNYCNINQRSRNLYSLLSNE